MVWPFVLFIIGLVCLIKGGDWFVDGATGIARRFHIPEILIGATVVSIGTTLPEVMVSATGAIEGVGAMAYGNAIGSVICNTALISAITVTVRPCKVDKKPLLLPVIFFFVAAVYFCLTAYLTGEFSRVCGIILLLLFVAYMAVSVLTMGKKSESLPEDAPEESGTQESPLWKDILFLVLGAALIAVGAKFLVDNGTKIAAFFGVPETVIALTFVALGTSLPELITAITALIKGHSALSLGNIIGANLFNLVLVSGLSVTLAPFAVPSGTQIAGMNASFVVDIPVMVAVMLLLTVPTLLKGKLSRYQGIILLAIYVSYVTFQFVSGAL